MGKVWLVTGTSSGFGRELAWAVLEAGDSVVATARRPEQLADLVARYGDRVRAVRLDVTDKEAVATAVRTATDAFGSLDVVVNNAGYANLGSVEELSGDDFRAQIETNLFGLVNVTKAVLPVLRAQRSGHIIQFSSIGGRVGGTPGPGAYQTAKFAVEGFSEVVANEVKHLGIKVTIVEPGASGPTGPAARPLPPLRSARTTSRLWANFCAPWRPTAGLSPVTPLLPPAPSSRSRPPRSRRDGCCSGPTPFTLPARRRSQGPRRPRSGRNSP